jgi:hypothetical protein
MSQLGEIEVKLACWFYIGAMLLECRPFLRRAAKRERQVS